MPDLNKKTQHIGWGLTILIPLIIFFIPTGEFFDSTMKLFLMIVSAMLCIIVFENMNLLIPAILMPILFVLTGLAPAASIFGPWANFIPWMTLGGFLFAVTFNRIGLFKRMSYFFVLKTGGSFSALLYGIMTAGIVINIIVPAYIAIPMAAFIFGLCVALGLKKSKTSSAISIVAAMSVITATVFVYNNIIITMGIGQTVAPQYTVSFFENLWHNWPFIFLMYFMTYLVDVMYRKHAKEELGDIRSVVLEESKKLGPMSMDEKKAAAICIGILIFLMTGGLHGIPVGWGMAIGALFLFFPGINVGTDDDVKQVNFPIVFLVTAFMGMGGVAGYHGWGVQIGEMFMPHLAGASDVSIIMMLTGLIMALNLVLTPLAIQFSLTAPMTEVFVTLGMNPLPLWYLINHAVDLILIPHQIMLYLIFFGFGMIYLSDFIKISFMKLVVNLAFIPLIAVPWWRFVGLF